MGEFLKNYFSRIVLLFYPALLFCCLVSACVSRAFYTSLFREDSLFNYLTFFSWLIAGVCFYLVFSRLRLYTKGGFFYLFLSLFCLFVACEEINWAQRFFNYESPQFVQERVGHGEMSFHFVLTGLLGVSVEKIGGVLILVYGVVLPFVAFRNRQFFKLLCEKGVALPPLLCAPGFAFAILVALCATRAGEQELSELFIASSFLIFSICSLSSRSLRPLR